MNPNELKIIGMCAGGKSKFYGCKDSEFRGKGCICAQNGHIDFEVNITGFLRF